MDIQVAPLDTYAQRITMGVAYLGGMLMMPLLFAYLANIRWYGLFIPTVFAFLLALLLSLAYASRPKMYVLEEKTLVIKRQWMPALRVPLDKITGVSPVVPLEDMLRLKLRFAFNPGLFGYQGPFELEPYGRVFFLATHRERLIAIVRPGAPPLILSPARPRAFIDMLNEHRLVSQNRERPDETDGSEDGTVV